MGVRQGCIKPLWLFNVYMKGVMKGVKLGMGRRGGIPGGWERVEMPGLLYADELVLCGE